MSSASCKKCTSETASYMFKKVSEKHGTMIFYSNPAKAKIFRDHEDLFTHFEHMLARVDGKHIPAWSWVVDGDGFDTDHLFEVRTGINILELITQKHVNTLKEIIVINPSVHLKVMLKVILPFLHETLRQKMRILDDRTYSILEFM